jgi:hypothetical protein
MNVKRNNIQLQSESDSSLKSKLKTIGGFLLGKESNTPKKIVSSLFDVEHGLAKQHGTPAAGMIKQVRFLTAFRLQT